VNRMFLALSAFSLGGVAQPCVLSMTKAATPNSRPLRLEGMDYLAARRIILDHGWRPAAGPCSQVSDRECASFPEIQVCSGVQLGPCTMVFNRQDRCLIVGTSGSEPTEGQEESDTHVRAVYFRHGHCSKNTN
jgi:hypothetical protein